MVKLIEHVLEYFLGTETIKFYRDERSFYREFVTDSKVLKRLSKNSKLEEGGMLLGGKIIPDLFGIGIVTYSLATRSPLCGVVGLLFNEGFRLSWCARIKSRKNRTIEYINLIKSKWNENQEIEDLVNKWDKEGEEWKKS